MTLTAFVALGYTMSTACNTSFCFQVPKRGLDESEQLGLQWRVGPLYAPALYPLATAWRYTKCSAVDMQPSKPHAAVRNTSYKLEPEAPLTNLNQKQLQGC